MCIVTDHAVNRYVERVANVDHDVARDCIMSARAVIDIAADFGCRCVLLGNGARLKLAGDVVVTVLPKRGH
jgi:hypothetical protein